MSTVEDPTKSEAYRLWAEACDLAHAGRAEEAAVLYRRAIQLGDLTAQTSLGTLLTDLRGEHWAEGMHWLRRGARAGDGAAAWNLAMEYRLRGNRRRYLHWVEVAVRLGDEDAVLIYAEIRRRREAARPWPMFSHTVIERHQVEAVLQDFRDGDVTGDELQRWFGQVDQRESTLELDEGGGGPLAEVVREAARAPITPQRARELLFKLAQ